MSALLGLGALLGLVLYHAAFGFTAACRRLFVDRDPTAVRAQVVMLGVALLLFTPILAGGQGIGIEVTGAKAPLGIQVAIGAFLFGLGMQLGNGCGPGMLFTLGGGSTRMTITLIFFCVGSFWGSLDAIVLGEQLGWGYGAGLQLILLTGAWWNLGRSHTPDTPRPLQAGCC